MTESGGNLTREEALALCNRRGARPGIIGMMLDVATGSALDRAASLYGMRREPAVWLGFKLPWGQRDETLRSRIWLAFQEENHERR